MIDLVGLSLSLWPRRRTIMMVVGLCIAATLVGYALIPPRYEATTALLVHPGGLQVVERDLRSTERSANSDDNIVNTQMRVMTTDSVLRRVVEDMDLTSDPEFNKPSLGHAVKTGLQRMLGLVPSDRDSPELVALRALREKVWTERSGNSYVIQIHARTNDPEKSVAIANGIAQAYLDGEFQASAEAAQRAAGSLSDGLDELRAQVREAERAVAHYKAENDLAGSEGRPVTEQQLSELNVRLIEAEAATAGAKAKLEQWQRLSQSGSAMGELSEALGSQTISQLRTQYALLEQRHAEARLVYGDRHPSIRTIDMQLRSLRTLISDELHRIGGAVRNTYESALQNETVLRARLEELKQKTFDTGFAQVRLRELERHLETNRTVYQAFLQRTQEVTEQQALDVSNARIVTIATVPDGPSRAPLTFLLFLATAIGLGLSVGYLILREQMRLIGRSRGAGQAWRG